MRRAVPDHSNLEVIISFRWMNDSGVAKTFIAILDGNTILNVAFDADRPFHRSVNARLLVIRTKVKGMLFVQRINASYFIKAALRHRTICLIDTVEHVIV